MTRSTRKCYKCGGDSKIVDSRDDAENGTIWRKRMCKKCGAIWLTWEVRWRAPLDRPMMTAQDANDLERKCARVKDALSACEAAICAVIRRG